MVLDVGWHRRVKVHVLKTSAAAAMTGVLPPKVGVSSPRGVYQAAASLLKRPLA